MVPTVHPCGMPWWRGKPRRCGGANAVFVSDVGPNLLQLQAAALVPNDPLRLPDGLHWSLLELYRRSVLGLRAALAACGPGGLASVRVDSWVAVITGAALGLAETGTNCPRPRARPRPAHAQPLAGLQLFLVRADTVVADVPDARAPRSTPATDLDQRPVGHERHRAQPGRGRARPTPPARRCRSLTASL